jgi:hypothetical protein
MRSRLFAAALLGAGILSLAGAADQNAEAAKKALQVEDIAGFVGVWKGDGDAKVNGKKEIWKETFDWGWKFGKDGDAWLALNIDNGKFVKKAALRYDPAKKVYVLTATDKDGNDRDYAGKLTKKGLVLEGKDKAGDVRRLTMYTLADGARMSVKAEVQEGGKGPFSDLYKITATKEGESFAGGGKKKNECIVTGGLGTIPVSFSGKTYYVCCSGCRDEFNAEPKKYIDEFEKKKK